MDDYVEKFENDEVNATIVFIGLTTELWEGRCFLLKLTALTNKKDPDWFYTTVVEFLAENKVNACNSNLWQFRPYSIV